MSDPTSSPAAQLLKPLLAPGQSPAKKEAAGSSIDVPTVVSDLCRAAKKAEDRVEDFVYNVWTDVLNIAGDVHHSSPAQEELADVICKLRKTSVEDPEGKALTIQSAGHVWTDLPTFGWVAREIWNLDIRDQDNKPESITKFNNQSALLARLTARAHKEDAGTASPLDYSLYALWSLRDAFEQTPHHPAAAKNAAIWVTHASEALRALAYKGHSCADNTGQPGTAYGSQDWKGFNQERWNVWKKGFQDALQEAGIKEDEEARALLQTAIDRME